MVAPEISQSNIMKLFSSTMQNAILMTESMTGLDLYQAFSVTTKLQFQIVETLTQLSIAGSSESTITSTKNIYFPSNHPKIGDSPRSEPVISTQSLVDQLNIFRNSFLGSNPCGISRLCEHSDSSHVAGAALIKKSPSVGRVHSLSGPSGGQPSLNAGWPPQAPSAAAPCSSSNLSRPPVVQPVRKESPTHVFITPVYEKQIDSSHSGGGRYSTNELNPTSSSQYPKPPLNLHSNVPSSIPSHHHHHQHQFTSPIMDLTKLSESSSLNEKDASDHLVSKMERKLSTGDFIRPPASPKHLKRRRTMPARHSPSRKQSQHNRKTGSKPDIPLSTSNHINPRTPNLAGTTVPNQEECRSGRKSVDNITNLYKNNLQKKLQNASPSSPNRGSVDNVDGKENEDDNHKDDSTCAHIPDLHNHITRDDLRDDICEVVSLGDTEKMTNRHLSPRQCKGGNIPQLYADIFSSGLRQKHKEKRVHSNKDCRDV